MSDAEVTGGGFGALLRKHRLASGLTQEDLAEQSGLSVRGIAYMEQGRTARPYRRSVQLLADALELTGPERELLARAVRLGAAGDSTTRRQAVSQPAADGTHAPAVVPRQLPPAVPHFAGRADELKTLDGLLAATGVAARTMTISAVAGTAGVGKTTLAVHWAHAAAGQFPNGQFYVNLRGFDPSNDPVQPAEAIRGFLDALGVPPGRIPATPQARAGLYRSLMADRSMLILLDNARDADQVRPLLPGSPACAVVVTSRSQLAGLVAVDGACPLFLDALTPADAGELLSRRLGAERLAGEPAEVAEELIGLCARLPLALAIVAARAATNPGLTLKELAGELRVTARRLDAIDTGEATTSLRAVFSWSYQMLSEPAARVFRLLGVHFGPDISAPAAASLAGICAQDARRVLHELTEAHVLREHVPGRFAFHDLLRAYAAELAGARADDAEQRAALRRVLDHYLHTCRSAAFLTYPGRDPIPLADPEPTVLPEDLHDRRRAMAWLQAERPVLLAAIAAAGGAGFDTHAWQIPWTMAAFLDLQGYWHDFAVSQQTAIAAARRLGDTSALARAHRNLAAARARLGSYDDAGQHHEQALNLYRSLGDDLGQARVHSDMSWVLELRGNCHDAIVHAKQALAMFQAAGHAAGEARALNLVGWFHAVGGDLQRALAYCERSLDLCRQLGIGHIESDALDSLGDIHHRIGDYAQAISCCLQALQLRRELGDRSGQADTLIHLGDSQEAAGDQRGARQARQDALALLEGFHDPRVAQIRVKLRPLGAESSLASDESSIELDRMSRAR